MHNCLKKGEGRGRLVGTTRKVSCVVIKVRVVLDDRLEWVRSVVLIYNDRRLLRR